MGYPNPRKKSQSPKNFDHILAENYYLETRNFIDRVFVACADGREILPPMSERSKTLLKSLFENETYLYDDAERVLDIEKLLMLNIRAIVTGYQDFLHRIREEILRLDDLSVHRKFNQLLLDHDIRKIILSK